MNVVIIALVAIVLLLGIAVAIAYLVFGPLTIHHFGHDLIWETCDECTAGAQWWNGRSWGPIPEHIRMVRDGHFTFDSPQGNIRQCPHCQLGGHWRDRNGSQLLHKRTWRNDPKGPGDDG